MENKITIYTLADPRNGEIRYVGKAVDLVKRLSSHLRHNDGSYRCNWVQSIRRLGLRPTIEPLEIVNESEWEDAERFWIENLKHLGFNLVNADGGGRGGFPRTDEIKRKISAKHKGKILSKEHRSKLSLAAKNRSAETRNNMRLAQLGKTYSQETRAKLSAIRTGKKRSPEAIEKTASKLRGRKQPQEQIDRRAARMRGTKQSAEWIKKRMIKMTGRIVPKEVGMKISASKMGHEVTPEAKDKIRSSISGLWKSGFYSNRKKAIVQLN